MYYLVDRFSSMPFILHFETRLDYFRQQYQGSYHASLLFVKSEPTRQCQIKSHLSLRWWDSNPYPIFQGEGLVSVILFVSFGRVEKR